MVVVVVGGGGGGGHLYDSVGGAENGHFSCPTKTRPKISQRGLNLQLFPQPVLPRVNATFMLGSSLWGRK